MKRIAFLVFTIALAGCENRPAKVELLNSRILPMRDIEQLPFMDAYLLWQQEMESLKRNAKVHQGVLSYGIPTGSTDYETGKFTPSVIAALECRLGKEAHLHELFLLTELADDADVSVILESSPLLCEKYGIISMARVQFIEGRGCVPIEHNGYDSGRQALWLKATPHAD